MKSRARDRDWTKVIEKFPHYLEALLASGNFG